MLPGFKVGHYTNMKTQTGLTVLLPDQPVKCHYHICGGAPATHSLTSLENEHLVDYIDALLFTGGSAFGLGAVSGVMQWLSEQGRGFPTKVGQVPIVPAAAIYDLGVGKVNHPLPHHAYAACQNASKQDPQGLIGAATGARVGKLFPQAQSMAGGLGYSELSVGDLQVSALAVVNCVGDVVSDNGSIVAGAEKDKMFFDTQKNLLAGVPSHSALQGQNTTLVAVMTNAKLDKSGLKRLAKMASAGLARAIVPAFTPFDGDIVFTISNGSQEVGDLLIGALAAEAVAKAIRRSIE